jgi:phage terminase large subunit
LFSNDKRFVSLYGGRGSGKSHSVATHLLIKGIESTKRILCTREIQTSIKDSVYKLLADKIRESDVFESYYRIKEDSILGKRNGTEFIFKGLYRDQGAIKSTEGIDICWCFIAGTLIDGIPIENLKKNQLIKSYNHNTNKIEFRKIIEIKKRLSPETLYKLLTYDGSNCIVATGEHPVYVKGKGYTPISDIKQGDIIYAETFKYSRKSKMFGRMWRRYIHQYNRQKKGIHEKRRDFLQGLRKQTEFGKNEVEKSYGQSRDKIKNDKRRKWKGLYKSTTAIVQKTWSWMVERVSCNYWRRQKGKRESNTLQNRLSKYILQISNRMRWQRAFRIIFTNRRPEKRNVLKEYRVDSIEIQKQRDIKQLGLSDGGDYVYNLEVEVNNNYFANGILVHNCEEAQSISRKSLDLLIPTIRKENSQIIFTYNPTNQDDPVHTDYTLTDREDVLRINVNYYDNPFFPEVLRQEMEWTRKTDIDKYNHVWEGHPVQHSEAQIYYGKWIIDAFESPENIHFYQGLDFGFSQDPNAFVRCFIKDKSLYIDYESGGVGIEIDKIPDMIQIIPESSKHLIIADSARPETISYLRKRGWNISSTRKGKGSVEDGIQKLRAFEKIIIHPRCKNVIEEFRLYSYKIDKLTGKATAIPEDKNNHYMDALRYAIENVGREASIVKW